MSFGLCGYRKLLRHSQALHGLKHFSVGHKRLFASAKSAIDEWGIEALTELSRANAQQGSTGGPCL
jgi:hypothetical protein